MQLFGGILILLGAIALLSAGVNAEKAPSMAYLIGTFIPGVFLLLGGLAIGRQKSPRTPNLATGEALIATNVGMEARANSFKSRANWGVGCGILLMFASSGVAQSSPEALLAGLAGLSIGWALMIWGSANYMRWKGYTGWLGLFGYFLLPGLIILACFPNRRKRLLQRATEHVAELDRLAQADRKSRLRYLLLVVPTGLFFAGIGGPLILTQSSIDAAEWKPVDPAGAEFQALMPGTPKLEQRTQDTPAGKIEIHKLMVEAKGKTELYGITALRFPDAVSDQLGGREKLLELGRQDLLDASKGRIQNERPIVLGSLPGREVEILPPAGAVIKARIYATKTQIFQVIVHVPRIRLHSDDVQKYLDSFRLTAAPDAGLEPAAK